MRNRNVLIIGLGAAVLAACSGDDSSNGGGGSSGKTLISSSSAPADATCPNGGTKLNVGVDTNGNGTLDPNEITGTQEICSGAPATLTTVTPTGPDATCKNGGVIVKSGPDTNGNGKLDDSEVTQTQEICDGGSSAVLSITTALGQGNANCPLGGTETQSGPDNGAGGAVAGDGVLATSEITNTTYACNSDSGFYVGSFAPPPAVAGQAANKIDVHGGAGSAGSGGGSNGVSIQKGGTLGGHIKVFKTGASDASFTLPAYTPKFGATKLDVTADTTLQVHANSGQAADGEYYYIGNNLYFRQNAGNPQVSVTGVHVAAGKTFTLPDTVTSIVVPNDIFVEGTLQAAVSSGNSEGLQISTQGAFVATAGAKLSAAGAPVTNAQGGSGGSLVISALLILNQAALDTSGADGGATGANNGGSGGVVALITFLSPSGGSVYNTGAVKANGGNGTGGGSGGSAGSIVEFESQNRAVYNSGPITANGGAGSGTTGAGGPGAQFNAVSQRGGGVFNSGALNIYGGAASATCAATCVGGSAQGAQFVAVGGPLVNAADIAAYGGQSVGTTGGHGGQLQITSFTTNSLAGAFLPAGSVTFSGNLRLFGGDGASGGQGGNVTVQLNASNVLAGEEVSFLGYSEIDTYGGDGTTGGGSSGIVNVNNAPSNVSSPATGGVINYADIKAYGGAATAGSGGASSGVLFETANGNLNGPVDKGQIIYNAGNIDTHSGASTTTGLSAGAITFRALERIDNLGALTAFGGASTGTSGGTGAGIALATGGGIGNGGALTSSGGAASGASGQGGTANFISIQGNAIVNSGALTSNGGNSNGVAGANGGGINVYSQSVPTANTGAISVAGGTGTPAGNKGNATIDGIQQ